MLALIDDLHARLTAAGLTVLRPEQREVPLAGAKPGQPGGLAAYLAAHPQGYVQLETPQGVGVSGAVETFWIPLGCVAATPQASDALSRTVLSVLCGIPGRAPGLYTQVIPDGTRALNPAAYLTRPTVTRPVIGGQI